MARFDSEEEHRADIERRRATPIEVVGEWSGALESFLPEGKPLRMYRAFEERGEDDIEHPIGIHHEGVFFLSVARSPLDWEVFLKKENMRIEDPDGNEITFDEFHSVFLDLVLSSCGGPSR